jgi:hypothetical protein
MHQALRFRLAAPFAAMLLLPALAVAQAGNQSDIGFPNTTGSGASGGSFAGPGLRTVSDLFSREGQGTRFRSSGIGCAVRTRARAYADSVAAVPRPVRIAAVDALLAGSPSADPAAVAAALAGRAPRAREEARRLADALRGLYAPPSGCPDRTRDYPEAGRWEEAFRAYRAFMRVLPDEALAPPAPELLAVHDALREVLPRSTRRREGR